MGVSVSPFIQEIYCYLPKLTSALLELQWLAYSLKEPPVLRHHLRQLLRGLEACNGTQLLPYFFFLSICIPLALFVICLVFSALISILYLVQVMSRLSTRASSSCYASARASMSTAIRRSVIFLPSLLFFPIMFFYSIQNIHSRKC